MKNHPVQRDVRQDVLGAVAEGASLLTPEGRIVLTNPAEDRLFGYGPGELAGRDGVFQDARGKAHHRRWLSEVADHLRRNGAWRGERSNRRKDGQMFFTCAEIIAVEFEGAPHWLRIQRRLSEQDRAQGACRMTAPLPQSRAEGLREIEARVAIEAGRMAVYHRHVGGDVVEPSAELNRFLGYPEAAHPSAEELRSRVWPGDFERIEAAVQTVLDRGECFFEGEFRWRRPDGDVRWHMVRGEAQRDADGSPTLVVGVLVDITERKQAEERLALLAREVDHRANNLLAVAQATVRLSKAPSVDDLRATILGRIDALAHAHALIAESEWRGADLERLIQRELKPYAGEGIANVVAVGPPVALSGAMAQAMAMALHELATNAAKYGAFSTDLGRVEVAWFRTPDVGLVLRWTEIGGPAANPPKGRGFGMRLIEETAVRQLGGELHLDWRPSGLVCEFKIPGARLATGQVPAASILSPALAPEPITHA